MSAYYGIKSEKGSSIVKTFAAIAATWLCLAVAQATPPPSGVAPVLVPAGGFSIEGDIIGGASFPGVGDWVAGPGGAGVLDATGAVLNPATTFHFIDAYNSTTDDTFGGGLKWTDNPNLWTWTSAKASAKTDINNVLMHVASDADGHTWLILAADRASNSGDSYIDFEFLQNSLYLTNNNAFYSAGPNGGRTQNDLLLSLAFTSGGSVADFFAWRWLPGTNGFAYADATASLSAGKVFVATSATNVAVPFGAFGQNTYLPNTLAEAAVDLTALLGNFDPCLSIGVKSIMVKTKTSQSSSASINDFINPIQYTMRLGPSAYAGPAQARCNEGASTSFPLTGEATRGLFPIASTTWSVQSGSATIEVPSSLVTTAHVASASATLRLTVLQANGCLETSDVVLTVAPVAASSITGASVVCPQSTTTFTGPDAMAGYGWSIAGNGVIVGSASSRQVTVAAGSSCGQSFSLALIVTNGICSGSASLDVLVNDTNPPTLTIPANVVLEGPADTRTSAIGVATAIDDCGSATVDFSDAVTAGCGGSKVIARTWTATDLCGNVTSKVQTITVQDTTPPSITAPRDLVLECPADTATSATGVAVATDTFSSVTVAFTDSVSNSCAGAKVIVRTWTATDACGNAASALQKITVLDTKAPSLKLPASVVLECPADTSTAANGAATASDACGQVTISFSDSISNSCGGTKVISRLWTAVDECGNSTNGVQTITVRDTTAPRLTVPANVVLECPADTTTNRTGAATAIDTCGTVAISYSDIVSNSCGATKTISRLWTAVDECGNSTSATQTITVRDTTPPVLTAPRDLVLECPADTGTNRTGVATAQDACGTVTISYADAETQKCGATKVIARVWTAVDACGNSTSATQTITVQDTTPPDLFVPQDLVLDCPADTRTNATGVAQAQDACGTVLVSYKDSVTNDCGGTEVIARLWTAVDVCGNTTNGVQTITVRDVTPPSLVGPADVVLECPADTTTNATGVAVAGDSCGTVTLSYKDVTSGDCGGTKLIVRTWSAVDACGNATNVLQKITVRDTKAPSLTLPTSVVLECPADTSTNVNGVAKASDACGQVTLSFTDSISNSCGGTKVISRLWTAVDQCGNSTNGVQTITVRDTTPPVLKVPANIVLECPADTSTNRTGAATATDTCGAVAISYSDIVKNDCGATKTISRLWTAVDECGNSSSATQTITVRDTTPPVLTAPHDLVLECPADTTTNSTGVAVAQDACGSVTVSYSDAVTANCGGTKAIVRTWTAVDACGNATSRVQNITVRDTTAPSLTLPANVVLECPADTRTNATGVALAQDGCGSVTVSYSDIVSNSCGATKTISRLWTAVDQCGNSTNGVQTITVRDTTPPSLILPVDLVLECLADTRTNATGVAIAQDACGSTAIGYSDVVSNACGGTKVIARTWTAVDACGNSTNGVQKITVRDTTPPTLRLPASLVLDCPGDTRTNVTGVALAQDGCGSVTVSYSDVVSNSCAQTKTIQRLWTAVDQCGNATNGLQTIIVRDITPPAIAVQNISVQCVGDVPAAYTTLAAFRAAGGTATDSCSTNLTFSLTSDSGLVGRCPGKVTRVYRATDDCGNFAECTQTITVNDTIAPVLRAPTNLTVECSLALDPAITGQATATDNCDTNVNITYSDAPVSSQYSFKWYAADPASNSAPYLPTYVKLSPANLPVPDAARRTGRAADPLRNAVAFGPRADLLDALTSLGGEPMCFGQVVPFEVVIGVSGAPGRERGTIEFTSDWSTHTSSNDEFGYDTNYMVYAAFVDTADPGTFDPNQNARIESFSSTVINPGTIDEKIHGTFRVSGLDIGDQVVVEIWVVLKSSAPRNFGGTIAADLVSAQKVTSPPEPISVGNQTVSIGNLNKIMPLPAPQPQPPLGPLPAQPPVLPGAIVSAVDRTWTATDSCGNQSTAVQRITVRDTVPPVLSLPADLVLEYPADTTTNNTGAATAQDACGSALVSYSDTVTNGCGNTMTIFRLWMAIDNSGNATNATQTIKVQDTTAPVITAPANVVLEYPADTSTKATGMATAQDADGSVSISFNDSVATGCGPSQVITRLWTAVDQCGNSATATQTITVRDTTAPRITPPANVTLEYPADTTPAMTGTATAQDAGGVASVTFSDQVANGCGQTKFISRVWTAVDQCGNNASATQTITVRDTTAPAITAPANLTLEYPANTSTNATGVATAQDANGPVTVSYSDVVSNGTGVASTIFRTWTATDACGNSSSALQTITVRDTSSPAVTVPVITTDTAENLAPGGSSNPTLETVYTNVFPGGISIGLPNDGNPSTPGLTWDGTTNGLSALESILSQTNQSAGQLTNNGTNSTNLAGGGELALETVVLTINIGLSTNDSGGSIPSNLGSLVYSNANDSLNGQTVSQILEVANEVLGGGSLPAGYDTGSLANLLENINNSFPSTGTSAWALEHLGAPMVVVQCAGQVPAPEAMNVRVTDNSGQNVTLTVLPDVVSNQATPDNYLITRTWVATDVNGNSSTVSVQIQVNDTTAPVLTLTSNLVYNSSEQWTLADPVAVDNCGPATLQLVSSTTNNTGTSLVIERLWTATDRNGNSASATQTITVNDTTAPTITSPPANVVVEYPGDTSPATTGTPVAQDNIGSVTVTYNDVVSTGTTGNEVITRTWTVTDGSGNTTTVVQTITVQDTTAPTMTAPANVTVELGGNTSPTATGTPIAQDASGSVTVTYSDVVSTGTAGNSVITRTWTATDASGNSSTAVQTITVHDTTAPTMTAPANVTVEFGGNTSPTATGTPIAQDASGSVTVTYSDVVSTGTAGNSVITRTWTATDASGNSSTAVQTITVHDTTAPTITAPANVTVEFGGDTSPTATGTPVTQDASGSVSVTYKDVVSNGTAGNSVITRTWTATDASGNSSTAVQTITVHDTTAPTITAPANVTVEFGGDTSPTATGTPVTQDASGSVSVTYKDVVSNGAAGNSVITRTWTATDASGNSSTAVQTITVHDTTAPTITAPANVTVQYGGDTSPAATGTATAHDASGSVTITYADVVSSSGSAGNTVITRTWTATDASGNSSTAQQSITILSDGATQPPVIIANPPCLNAGLGTDVTLNVTASGMSLGYQWLFNGNPVPGATNSALLMTSVQFTNAGVYSVIVRNSAGSVTSSKSVMNVVPPLSIRLEGEYVVITWPGTFTLQTALTVDGSYTDLTGVISPYRALANDPYRFFRLAPGEFSIALSYDSTQPTTPVLDVTGAPGLNFSLEACYDLVNWVELGIATAPFHYVDQNAGVSQFRWYRAVPILECAPASQATVPPVPANIPTF